MLLCRVANELLRWYRYSQQQSRKVRYMREEERSCKARNRAKVEQCERKALGSQDTPTPYKAAEE